MNYALALVGALIFVFRIWLAEFKLQDELGFRRHYLSRVVNYHTFIALMLGLENPIFNAIVMTCFPVMLLTTIWDYNFFSHFRNRKYWQKNRGWLLIERFTLHPPILITGLLMYLNGLTYYIPRVEGFFPYIAAMFLVYLPFFVFDERWIKKYNWPQALIMIVLMFGSTLAFMLIGLGTYGIDFSKIFF